MEDEREQTLPPYDLEAEETALGSVLLKPDIFPSISTKLAPTDFYRDKNQWVYEAMLELQKRKEYIDQVTVSHELQRKGRLENLGGPDYLSNLIFAAPTALNAEYYADLVKRCAHQRALIEIGERIQTIGYDQPADLSDAFAQAQRLLVNGASEVEDTGGFRSALETSVEVLSHVQEQFDTGFIPGVRTGIPAVDRATGGMRRSNLWLVAARPKVGKTMVSLNIASRVAKRGEGVGIVSLEMTTVELLTRIACFISGTDMDNLRRMFLDTRIQMEEAAEYNNAIAEALNEIQEWPLWIDDSPAQTTWQVEAKLIKLLRRESLSLLIVDHISLLSDNRKEANVKRLDDLSYRLKCMAKEYNIPILCLCQLSRASEHRDDKRPKLHDLRESGGLEQNADVVVGLYRPVMHNKKNEDELTQEERESMEFIYLGDRHGPRNTGTSLRYDERTGRIKD